MNGGIGVVVVVVQLMMLSRGHADVIATQWWRRQRYGATERPDQEASVSHATRYVQVAGRCVTDLRYKAQDTSDAIANRGERRLDRRPS